MMRPNDPPSPVKATRTPPPTPRRRNSCGICCALFLEFVAWALAVVALCTSFWLVPRHGRLHDLAHAGLWIACDKPASGDLLFSNVNASQPLGFSASISALSTDLHATANPGAEPGCTNSVALYGAFGSDVPLDFAPHLRTCRILAIAFLGFGLAKALGGTLAATAFGSLRRCVGCFAGISATGQLLSGWAVCGLFLYVVNSSHLGVADLGWSWWLFLASLINATFANASFCCV